MNLQNIDCLEALAALPDASVDLLVTDPPYRISGGGCRIVDEGDECSGILSKRRVKFDDNKWGRKWIKKDGSMPAVVQDGRMFEHSSIMFDDWLPTVFRVLKPGTHAYIMVNGRGLYSLQTAAQDCGFVFQNLLAWNKGNQTPNKFYMNRLEYILMLSKRPARNINGMGSSTLISIPNIRNKAHPTEKPVDLMRLFVENSTDKGQVVLDPFMGVGTTAVACLESNREMIGFEIDKEFYDVAVGRVKNGIPKRKYKTGDLFSM